MTDDTAAPRFTSEQMRESAETLDCFGSPFKTYAAMLRQGADAVREAQAGKVLREKIEAELEGDDSEEALLLIDQAAKIYDAAIKETK